MAGQIAEPQVPDVSIAADCRHYWGYRSAHRPREQGVLPVLRREPGVQELHRQLNVSGG